ncbi:MAG: 1-acyl-sn-glycerol-3-phosphate acyltransferase [Hyphomicrobium sp.]
MDAQIILPFWAVLVLGTLAAVAVLDRLLIPSVRWALRHRANRAIDELNTRLKLHIQSFKMTKRQVLTDRLLCDPDVLSAVENYAAENKVPREVAMHKAERYAREIVPSFSAYAYFKIGARLARRLSQMLYRVRLGYTNDDALKAVPADSSVVFVINHRSNMDYVLVTYVAASSSALSYAVGEWAQVWGLRGLIRSMGAYFIRRDSRDALYRKILARYVDMATKAGVVQAIFPEGGLTRDGSLRPPKFGLLSYMVTGFDPYGARDVVFIPVGLNYDRVLEDRVLTAAAAAPAGSPPRFRFGPSVFAKFIGHNLWLAMRGRWHRYGYACVSFGQPVSLRHHLKQRGADFRAMAADARAAEVETLGNTLMQAVGKVVPALPVSLVATALLDAGYPLNLFELKGRVFALIHTLEHSGAYVHIPRHDREYAIEVGLRMLTSRHLVIEKDASFSADPAEVALLRYYANAIAHLLPGGPVVVLDVMPTLTPAVLPRLGADATTSGLL